MENLVTKGITYAGLRELFNKDEDSIQTCIYYLKNEDFRLRLTNEAKEYWAKVFNTDSSKVYYGNLGNSDFSSKETEPKYEYVVGNVSLEKYTKQLSSLKGILGRLYSVKMCNFPNLEFVSKSIELGNYFGWINRSINLPKLKKCNTIRLYNGSIKNLALEKANSVELSFVKVKKLNLKKVNDLTITMCPIEDLTELQEVYQIKLKGLTGNELHINEDMKVSSFLYSGHLKKEILSTIENFIKQSRKKSNTITSSICD